MLGFMASDYEVGIYSVSSKIYRIVKQMLSAILIVSIPRLALLMGQRRMREYRKTLTQIFNILTMLVLPAVVGLFILSKEIVLLISNSAYIRAVSSLRLLSIALIFCIFGWIFNQCVLIPARKGCFSCNCYQCNRKYCNQFFLNTNMEGKCSCLFNGYSRGDHDDHLLFLRLTDHKVKLRDKEQYDYSDSWVYGYFSYLCIYSET